MDSIARKKIVVEFGTTLALEIPQGVPETLDTNTAWTLAVYDTLKKYAKEKGWKIYPPETCYKGEYLCDFTLFEDGYGCRIACESQWSHWSGNNPKKVEWAFEKLLGVKSDIKLFIFEGAESEWPAICDKYLTDYAQLSVDEAFLILHWQAPHFIKSWWQPKKNGKQEESIHFEEF